jgi:gliding motility-associated lipoprotein GldH
LYFRRNKLSLKKFFVPFLFLLLGMASCDTIDLFEKNVVVPNHAWSYSFKPEISFEIRDTVSAYQIFFVIRHTDAYGFNNIWIKADSRAPGDSAWSSQRFDCPLSTNDRWLGSAMDDIYEHRILLFNQPVKFRQPGTYTIRLEQVMRENPLKHVMNVGVRVEKQRS